MPTKLGFAIVGTGMIAGVIANAVEKSTNAKLCAVSGRRIETAKTFVRDRNGVDPVQGFENLLGHPDVEAVYIATPTAPKEEIALAAIEAGKHVLVDKPFVDKASVERMTSAAMAKGVVWMDATHFVHHPRTAEVKRVTPEKLGLPRSLHTAFYFPFSERDNIRFDVQQEPMGAIGDMAWYSMRAIVEYLRPSGNVEKVATVAERDPETGSVVRASGLISFTSGEVSTFDIGYTAGAALMDLQLLGTTGVISMDDFVLDWANSWAFQSAESKTGYSYRTGPTTRADVMFLTTPTSTPQEVLMVQNFVDLANSQDGGKRSAWCEASLKTQEFLDTIWSASRELCTATL